jgi:hypothetical protein
MCLRVNIQDCYLPKLSQKPNYSFKQDFNIRAVIDMKQDNILSRIKRSILVWTEFTRQNLKDPRYLYQVVP